MKLWELSHEREGKADILLPPKLLAAALDEARAKRSKAADGNHSLHKHDVSFLHDAGAPHFRRGPPTIPSMAPARPQTARQPGEQQPRPPQERGANTALLSPRKLETDAMGWQRPRPRRENKERAPPAGRVDALVLAEQLERQIASGSDTMSTWDSTFNDLVAQARSRSH